LESLERKKVLKCSSGYVKNKQNVKAKGSLISEGILTLVPLPKNDAKSLPGAESLNLPPFTVYSK
jgi:hypothetical protein